MFIDYQLQVLQHFDTKLFTGSYIKQKSLLSRLQDGLSKYCPLLKTDLNNSFLPTSNVPVS